jgi:hypothetical protein
MVKIRFKALLRFRFPGRLPGLAQSSNRFPVKRLPELHLSPARHQLPRTEEGTAQDPQTNAIGLYSQHMGSDHQHTKEAFLLHSREHMLVLERGGGSPDVSPYLSISHSRSHTRRLITGLGRDADGRKCTGAALTSNPPGLEC